MAAVSMSEAVEYGIGLLVFGIVVGILAVIVFVFGVAGGGEGTLVTGVVAIGLVYAALLGSIYKVIADGVKRGVEAAETDREGEIPQDNQTQTEAQSGQESQTSETETAQTVDPNEAVIRAVNWYKDTHPEPGITQDTLQQFKNASTIENLPDTRLKFMVEIIDEYAEEHGSDEALRKARKAVINTWENKTGEEYE